MRHRKSRVRIGKKPALARAMERNLVTSVLLYESIRTTKIRAKVIQPIIDRLIAQAKRNPDHVAIRAINRVVTDKNASRKIMEVFKQRYAKRSSGFTRAIPAGSRKGDGASLVDLTMMDAALPGASEKKSSTAA